MTTSNSRVLNPQVGDRYLYPGEPGYDQAVAAWNPLFSHDPDIVSVAESAEDVVDAVRLARSRGLGVGVMATGHGTGIRVGPGGLLVNTSAMKGLSVDPVNRTAWVQAGVTWAEINARAARYGLIGLQGSTSLVGAVGYSLGGGFGWLGRHFGFASQSIAEAKVVTANGELITVSQRHHPDLFWGLKGSAGNLGIVTALEVRLFELDVVYGGALFYPMTDAHDVLTEYAAWAAQQPDEMASSMALMNFPPLPFLPEPLRGQSFAIIRVCYSGHDLGRGVAAVRELRNQLGAPVLDEVRWMPAVELDRISMDPEDPMPAILTSAHLPDLTPDAIDRIVSLAVPGGPLLMVEIRHLGGALRVPDDQLSPINRTDARFSINAGGLALTPDGQAATTAALEAMNRILAPIALGSAYVNFLEGEAGAARIRQAFSEAEWDRLVALKNRWDPANLFRFNRNIAPDPGADAPA